MLSVKREGNLDVKKTGQENSPFANIAKYAAIGLEFPGMAIGGFFLGYLIDRYFNTSPWFTVTITFFGFFGAVIRLVQWLRRFANEDRQT